MLKFWKLTPLKYLSPNMSIYYIYYCNYGINVIALMFDMFIYFSVHLLDTVLFVLAKLLLLL